MVTKTVDIMETRANTSSMGLLRQFSVAFIASFSVLTAGSAYTWIEPLMDRLKKPGAHLLLTSAEISWVASAIEIGPLITPVPVGFLVNRFGRKTLLLFSAPLYIFTWILVLTTKSYKVLLAVRVIQGMGIGIIMTTLPLYLGEIFEPRVRGCAGTFIQCMWYLGVIYVYCIGPFVTYIELTWVCLAAPLVFVIIFFWFPESPYYCILKERESEAEKSLLWLRGGQHDIADELKSIVDNVKDELKVQSRWQDLVLTKAGRNGLTIVIIVGLTTYMSGLRTVQAYASDTFTTTTGDNLSANVVTIVMGVLTLIATAFSSLLVDRLGRRPVLLYSGLASFVVLVAAAVFFYLEYHTNVDLTHYHFIPYLTITLYSVLMSFSSSIGFTLQAELFTTSARGLASGTTTLSTTLMCFSSLKLYHVFEHSLGLYFNYLIFCLCAGFGTLAIYFVMPETKGKTFAEIQKMLSK